MVLQVRSKRVGIGRAATRAHFAVALQWWCRQCHAQWLRDAQASLEEDGMDGGQAVGGRIVCQY